MQPGRIKSLVALALIAGSAGWLYSHLRPNPPIPEPLLHEGIGRVLAQQAATLIAPDGRVTLIRRDTSILPNPATESQVQGFVAGTRKAGLTVAGTNSLKLDPLRLVRVGPGDFFDWMRKQKEGDVVVSLLGPPVLGAAQKRQLGERPCRVVALCSGDMPRQVDLKSLFDMDLIQAAIIDRPDPPMVAPKSKDPQVWFDAYYRLVTRENLSDLPPPSASLNSGNRP